jgi:glutamyl-tRNA synthetase
MSDGEYKMRDERFKGITSAHRDDSVEDNLAHFDEMKAGSAEGLRWCIRAKISVDDPNKALRDPVIYRCNILPHHRTGYACCLPVWTVLRIAFQRQMENISYL